MIFVLISFIVGSLITYLLLKIKIKGFERLAQEILKKAEQERLSEKEKLDRWIEESQEKIQLEKEELKNCSLLLDKKGGEVEKQSKELSLLKKNLLKEKEELEHYLAKYAGLSSQEAKLTLLEEAKQEITKEQALFLQKTQLDTLTIIEKESARLLVSAMHRLSFSPVLDATVTTVSLPNEDLKRRIIGREGRNIRLLEELVRANFIIDDTPGAVVISSFDPLRKEIGRLTLMELLRDGRIHPARIEEVVKKSEEKLKQEMGVIGKEAAFQMGIFSLHHEITLLLGKLHYHFCEGQNVLHHALEVASLMGILAAELKLDVELAKRMGLLHDIGKAALSHQEGSHAAVGYQLAKKWGEKEEVAHAIGSHHDEIPPQTVEASLLNFVNKVSSQRIGARTEAIENIVKRSRKLELIASQYAGVETAYALLGGREIRVIVEADKIDDKGALLLAREIAKKIETEMSFPGKLKVTLIREKKIIEYAS